MPQRGPSPPSPRPGLPVLIPTKPIQDRYSYSDRTYDSGPAAVLTAAASPTPKRSWHPAQPASYTSLHDAPLTLLTRALRLAHSSSTLPHVCKWPSGPHLKPDASCILCATHANQSSFHAPASSVTPNGSATRVAPVCAKWNARSRTTAACAALTWPACRAASAWRTCTHTWKCF